ncbi:Ig-like domain-containing protein [Singulisphaera sp. Ch08]|uniref:Ig-like domain-containing protein n=1 Tax=Singulisphaera sp. Ch08 TaxID=3120278 RepID=A0AAU7CKS2_9BACT
MYTSPLTVGLDGNLWFTVTENHRSSPTASLPPTGFAIERVNVAAFPIPQPLSPTVRSLLRTGVHTQPTRLVLTFDAAMTPSSAQNTRNYIIVLSGPRGRVRPHTRPVTIRRASYDAASNTVTLTPRPRLPIHGYYRVIVRGSLTGTNGALLDGSGHGQPGTDYSALLHKSGLVTPSAAKLRSVAPRAVH